MSAAYVMERLTMPPHEYPFRYVSLYALQSWAPIWSFAVVAYAIGSYSLGMGLRPKLQGLARSGATLIAVTGAMAPILLIFPTDRYLVPGQPTTPSGYIHDSTAVAIVVLQSLALVFLCLRGPLARPLLRAWTAVNAGFALAWLGTELVDVWQWIPYVQRVLVLVLAGGLLAAAWTATHLTPAPKTAPVGTQEGTF
jgi:hypothetical protein